MDAVEQYLADLAAIHSTGAALPETSGYGALAGLLNEVGKSLDPKVRCVMGLKNQGADYPDGGLFTAEQWRNVADFSALAGQVPARGVVEVKSPSADVEETAASEQVKGYWDKYRLVLVTNYREFALVGDIGVGRPMRLESFRIADSSAAFWHAAAAPRKTAKDLGDRLRQFLARVLLHATPLRTPRDVAWFLASYARDARVQIEAAGVLPELAKIRRALEEALGITFDGDKGEHFFRSTLVQTLFYGVFSAWVLWHKESPRRNDTFDWRLAAHQLGLKVLRKLFYELAEPGQLRQLHLTQPLDWAGAMLNRVDRVAFFTAFGESHAVQYFYEPFLEAFDPDLRNQLGVWYTPPEIVEYMVARVDRALREELQIADGLADPRVYVLDPCCGTGAYLVETLRVIGQTLAERRGEGALCALDVKKAAQERVVGFEILPAPFVISHLQIGLTLQSLGAPLNERQGERAAVYLTNALTGWEPAEHPKAALLFPELQAERDAADRVKQQSPILVILGNPPYNGFAGLAVEEERALGDAYRSTKKAPTPEGQGLNDLYVRFFRMAERRIVDKGGKGIVCFISNYSWLDGLSYTGMRERYLEVFDGITVDCLNGDKFKTGKRTPDGRPDPSVFSTSQNREGIQIGTAIALLVRRERQPGQSAECAIGFRHFWGQTKRDDLLRSLVEPAGFPYRALAPSIRLGLPLVPSTVQSDYFRWPSLPVLLPVSIPGVKTSRDIALVEIDRQQLRDRMTRYFDPGTTDQEVAALSPPLMTRTAHFDPVATRRALVKLGAGIGQVVRFAYRPFDQRYVFWHPKTNLLDRAREELFLLSGENNLFLTSRQKAERQTEGTPFYLSAFLPDWHLTRPGSACFPLWTSGTVQNPQRDLEGIKGDRVPNLSSESLQYLERLSVGLSSADHTWQSLLFMHALATGYSEAYLTENADGLRQDWPRIPLPGTLAQLEASAALGRRVAALLDTEHPVAGVTSGQVRPELRVFGVPAVVSGEFDAKLTAGWGHAGKGGITMPGRGRLTERHFTDEEAACAGLSEHLGGKTCDVWLNDTAHWRNIPERVWDFHIGGYQVIKKWLSYREFGLLGRALTLDEVREVTNMARRIAALLLLGPELDANHEAVKTASYVWPAPHGS